MLGNKSISGCSPSTYDWGLCVSECEGSVWGPGSGTRVLRDSFKGSESNTEAWGLASPLEWNPRSGDSTHVAIKLPHCDKSGMDGFQTRFHPPLLR